MPISDKNRKRFDDAVNKAVKNNIVTTFIHYDNPNNIWPTEMVDHKYMEKGQREPDLSIFPYDYNTLRIDNYIKYEKLLYILKKIIKISETAAWAGSILDSGFR